VGIWLNVNPVDYDNSAGKLKNHELFDRGVLQQHNLK
jgi:hypothetical protein